MGFDLYGISPKMNTPKPAAITDFLGEDGWADYKKLSKNDTVDEDGNKVRSEEHEAYWKASAKWEDENPGRYFRNSVWWWRPLWDFVCEVADDILTKEDKENGHSNSGHIIDEEKSLTIVKILENLLKSGEVRRYEEIYNEHMDSLPLEDCEYCEGTGTRTWEDGDKDCNVCNTSYTKDQGIPAGKKKQFQTSYPFDVQNIEGFVRFCKQSGGFKIS